MLKQQPATPALAKYLNDHRAFLAFNAYLWKTIVIAQYGRGRSPDMPPVDLSAGADGRSGPVHEMNLHTQYFCQMTFCRGIDSFLVYISDLLTGDFRSAAGDLEVETTDDHPGLPVGTPRRRRSHIGTRRKEGQRALIPGHERCRGVFTAVRRNL